MGVRKITLESQGCCPYCKGEQGIKFYKKAVVVHYNGWKGDLADSKKSGDAVLSDTRPPKSVLCLDCGKRLEIN